PGRLRVIEPGHHDRGQDQRHPGHGHAVPAQHRAQRAGRHQEQQRPQQRHRDQRDGKPPAHVNTTAPTAIRRTPASSPLTYSWTLPFWTSRNAPASPRAARPEPRTAPSMPVSSVRSTPLDSISTGLTTTAAYRSSTEKARSHGTRSTPRTLGGSAIGSARHATYTTPAPSSASATLVAATGRSRCGPVANPSSSAGTASSTTGQS